MIKRYFVPVSDMSLILVLHHLHSSFEKFLEHSNILFGLIWIVKADVLLNYLQQCSHFHRQH